MINPIDVNYNLIYADSIALVKTASTDEAQKTALGTLNDLLFADYKKAILSESNPAYALLQYPLHFRAVVKENAILFSTATAMRLHLGNVCTKEVKALIDTLSPMLLQSIRFVGIGDCAPIKMDDLTIAYRNIANAITATAEPATAEIILRKSDIKSAIVTTAKRPALAIKAISNKDLEMGITKVIAGALHQTALRVEMKVKPATAEPATATAEPATAQPAIDLTEAIGK